MFHSRLLRPRRLSRTTVIVSTAVLALAVGGTAYATIPNSSTGVITGCYQTLLGNLRVIDTQAGQQCNLFEKRLDWNQAGVPGPKGDTGDTGPAGAQGPAGPSGSITGIHEVFATSAFDSSNNKLTKIMCPTGELATGGGYRIQRSATDQRVVVEDNRAITIPGGKPIGWGAFALEFVPSGDPWELEAFAICAPAS